MLKNCISRLGPGRHPPDAKELHFQGWSRQAPSLMLNQDFGTTFFIVLQELRGNSLIALEFREKLAENESNYKLHFDKVVRII